MCAQYDNLPRFVHEISCGRVWDIRLTLLVVANVAIEDMIWAHTTASIARIIADQRDPRRSSTVHTIVTAIVPKRSPRRRVRPIQQAPAIPTRQTDRPTAA
jgi:hypothetical protein